MNGDGDKAEQFDSLFLTIAQHHPEGAHQLLDACLSFLERKTDFFNGGSEGDWKKLFMNYGEKYEAKLKAKKEKEAARKAKKEAIKLEEQTVKPAEIREQTDEEAEKLQKELDTKQSVKSVASSSAVKAEPGPSVENFRQFLLKMSGDGDKAEQCDSLFLTIAQHHPEDHQLLDAFVSFLGRKGNFFTGGSEGDWEKLVMNTFKKHEKISRSTNEAELKAKKEKEAARKAKKEAIKLEIREHTDEEAEKLQKELDTKQSVKSVASSSAVKAEPGPSSKTTKAEEAPEEEEEDVENYLWAARKAKKEAIKLEEQTVKLAEIREHTDEEAEKLQKELDTKQSVKSVASSSAVKAEPGPSSKTTKAEEAPEEEEEDVETPTTLMEAAAPALGEPINEEPDTASDSADSGASSRAEAGTSRGGGYRRFEPAAVAVLVAFAERHGATPDEEALRQLSGETKLTIKQLSTWFKHRRYKVAQGEVMTTRNRRHATCKAELDNTPSD